MNGLKDWEKVPRTKLIQISERKWLRTKSLVSWKMKREYDAEIKRLKAETATAWKQAEIYQGQHLGNMQNAVEWMEKYEKASMELALYKQAEKMLI